MDYYFDHDMAAELVAAIDGHESEGTEFEVPMGLDRNASFTEFEVIAIREDGSEHRFSVQVRSAA